MMLIENYAPLQRRVEIHIINTCMNAKAATTFSFVLYAQMFATLAMKSSMKNILKGTVSVVAKEKQQKTHHTYGNWMAPNSKIKQQDSGIQVILGISSLTE